MRRRLTPERDWQATVVGAFEAHGWMVWHDNDSRKNAKGLPDIVAVKGRRIAFLELKNETRKVTPEQVVWLEALGQATRVYTGVLRPDGFDELLAFLESE